MCVPKIEVLVMCPTKTFSNYIMHASTKAENIYS